MDDYEVLVARIAGSALGTLAGLCVGAAVGAFAGLVWGWQRPRDPDHDPLASDDLVWVVHEPQGAELN